MKNIFISIISIIVFFLIVESALLIRGYTPISFENTFRLKVSGELLGEYDRNLFWRLKDVQPNFTEKNSLKIMILTDSVSVMYEGKGYPDILHNYLSNSIPDKNPVVFNGGVPGYTSFQGLKYFTSELLSYQPDIISVCYGWNDHWQSGNELPDKLQKPPNRFISNIVGKSRLFAFLRAILLKTKQNQYSSVGPSEFRRVSLKDYEDNIEKFVEIAKQNEIVIVLMTAPYLNGPVDWIPTHKEYNAVVHKIAKRNNVPLVNLVDKFKDRKNLFIEPEKDQAHYNWQGSEIVAQALQKVILKHIDK